MIITDVTPGQFFAATKRTVTIQAALFDGSFQSAKAIIEWAKARGGHIEFAAAHTERIDGSNELREIAPAVLYVVTLEGRMAAPSGHFILQGVEGEFYPCEPGIFAKTYHVAGDEVDEETGGVVVNVHEPVDTRALAALAVLSLLTLIVSVISLARG